MADPTEGARPEITADHDADALYIRLADRIGPGEAVTQEMFPLRTRASEVVFDFDAEGRLLGIEILGIGGLLRPEDAGG